jgi:FKBP-type peptidyl-prolyl cis-trans isomerase FklB
MYVLVHLSEFSYSKLPKFSIELLQDNISNVRNQNKVVHIGVGSNTPENHLNEYRNNIQCVNFLDYNNFQNNAVYLFNGGHDFNIGRYFQKEAKYIENYQGWNLYQYTESTSYVNATFDVTKFKDHIPGDVILARAIKDALAGNKNIMSSEASGAFIQNYFQKATSKIGENNKKTGEEFLLKNKSKEGVTTLQSGLQYKILKAGTGEKPAPTDRVKVHYHGTLIDGTVFDSSVNRGEPATFGVTQVIQGWVEALQLMTTGSKWTLYIPANLAYGQQGPPSIGPNQALIFDVELLEIVK